MPAVDRRSVDRLPWFDRWANADGGTRIVAKTTERMLDTGPMAACALPEILVADANRQVTHT